MTTVVVVDDHVILLEGVKKLLETEAQCDVIGQASDGRKGVEIIRRLKPDIAVLDISMPGLNGLDAAKATAKYSPGTKVILLTMHRENPYVVEALDAGVHGYVIKSQTSSDLLNAIEEVIQNRVYLSPGISRIVMDAYRRRDELTSDPLTLREREVLQLIAEGKKTKEVAAKLNISVKTAESHRTRIMSKLDIHDTATLVRYAIRRGVIDA